MRIQLRMVLIFYNLALFLALTAGAPWWLWRMATTHKYRDGIWERLGRVPRRLLAEPGDDLPRRPVIWLHAVSVGEVLAVTRLVHELDAAFPGFRVMISTTTRTGQALAREKFGMNRVFYCPLDLPWATRAYLNALKPSLLILAETEFWPNLLSGCFRREIPVVVVNARISDRSWPRYEALRHLWTPFLSRLASVQAQSDLDAERVRALGGRADRIAVAGNLKFDVRATGVAEATRILQQQSGALDFIVAGSTLDGEETALLEAWPQVVAADTRAVLVLAPRHPERFAAVATMVERSGIPWQRRSEWQAKAHEPLRAGSVLLLDTIGELASVYAIAHVAFVGGSLIPAGGHNPLEPAQFGVPIVMGSHYANFVAIVDSLRRADALRIVAKDDLSMALVELLRDRSAAEAMGTRAREVFEAQAGATARCVEAIGRVLRAEVTR